VRQTKPESAGSDCRQGPWAHADQGYHQQLK
jgi:hypothetical protein